MLPQIASHLKSNMEWCFKNSLNKFVLASKLGIFFLKAQGVGGYFENQKKIELSMEKVNANATDFLSH